MVEAVACQVAVNLIFLGAFLLFHRRTRRMQRLMNDHLHSDHEHLQVTEELMRRVAVLDGRGLPFVVSQTIRFEKGNSDVS
jgi:hypothetical protein